MDGRHPTSTQQVLDRVVVDLVVIVCDVNSDRKPVFARPLLCGFPKQLPRIRLRKHRALGVRAESVAEYVLFTLWAAFGLNSIADFEYYCAEEQGIDWVELTCATEGHVIPWHQHGPH